MNARSATAIVLVASAAMLSCAESNVGPVDTSATTTAASAAAHSPTARSDPTSQRSASGSPVTSPSRLPSTAESLATNPSTTVGSMPDEVFAAMVQAITSQRPGYRFRLTPDRLDGDWRLDGSADDGTGPGRLFVDVTVKPGNVEPNPCADPDFVQGGRCVRKLLPGGDWLVLRGLVQANGTRTVVAALVHPNRTGITAEASNITVDGRTVSIMRRDPLYTAADLGELIVAIDRAIATLTDN